MNRILAIHVACLCAMAAAGCADDSTNATDSGPALDARDTSADGGVIDGGLLDGGLPGPLLGSWSTPVPLGTGDKAGIAVQGTSAHVLLDSGGSLSYRRSLDEGVSWSGPVVIGTGLAYLQDPIATDGTNVYVVTVAADESPVDWLTTRPSGDLVLLRSRDNGVSWDSPVPITTGEQAFRMSMSVGDDGVLHLAWMDFRTGNFPPLSTDGDAGNDNRGTWDVRYARGVLEGEATSTLNWDAPESILVGIDSFGAERPAIRAFEGTVHLAWMAGSAANASCPGNQYGTLVTSCPGSWYMRSVDNGENWQAPQWLSPGFSQYASRPCVAASRADGAIDTTVVVNYDVYVNGGNNVGLDVYATRSTDDGSSFSAASPARLTDSNADSTHAFAAASRGDFYLAWHDGRSGQAQIMVSASADGSAWETPLEVSSAGGDTPIAATGDGNLHLVWLSGGAVVYSRAQIRPAL